MSRTKIAAHTGCGIHPDNTMASFLEGIRSGAHIVEVDVRTTKDGTAVLLHDDSPYLQDCTYEQLNRPEVRMKMNPAHGDHPVVKLEEILSLSPTHGACLNLDIKSEDAVAPAIREIRRFGAQDRVYLTGCTALAASRYPDVRSLLNTPDISLDVLADDGRYDRFSDEMCREAKTSGYVGLNMNHHTCLKPIVNKAHSEGMIVWVYTVNGENDMRRMLEAGVDGITTREVAKLREVVQKAQF